MLLSLIRALALALDIVAVKSVALRLAKEFRLMLFVELLVELLEELLELLLEVLLVLLCN